MVRGVKPCPRCGTKARKRYERVWTTVWCPECGVSLCVYDTETACDSMDVALDAWNRLAWHSDTDTGEIMEDADDAQEEGS